MLKVKFLDFNKRKNQKYAAKNLLFVILRLKSILKKVIFQTFSVQVIKKLKLLPL